MNILFTTSASPEKSPIAGQEQIPPLGLGFLISVTRNAGHNVFFIDNYLTPTEFIENDYLQRNQIDYIGIYTNTICYSDTLRMLKAIEELRSSGSWKGKIIVGGPHVSLLPDSVPEYVDYIVQGEGETAILKILEENVTDRTIREGRMENLDNLPFQPWDIFTKLPYDFTFKWMDIKPVFTLNTSRGCPYNCSFCCVDSIWSNKYAGFSADRIIAEIEYLKKEYDAKGIYFREDNFTLNKKRTNEFCDKLIRKKIDVYWACETRVNTICDENLVRKMSEAGCRGVYLGVESGSQRILDILNKQITISQIKKAISFCRKYKIRTYCSFLVGVPGETIKDLKYTKKLIKEMKPYKYALNIYVGIPTSDLYRQILAEKTYEYMDPTGLLYLPGFHIKVKYFYGKNSNVYVDYKFKKLTSLDRSLLMPLFFREIRRKIVGILDLILPKKFMKYIRDIKKKVLSHND